MRDADTSPVMLNTRICADCAVRNRSLCGVLDEPALLHLNRIGQRRHLAAGETLSWAGDEARFCGNLLSGVLKLTASTPDGREQIVGLLYPSDFVGAPFPGTVPYSIAALTTAEICLFPQTPFEHLLSDNAALEKALLQRTIAALDEARARMVMLVRQSAEEKVAAFLLDMAARAEGLVCRASADAPLTFDLPLSRGQIADVLGLTIETVSRQMTRLKRAGIIALPGVRTVTIRHAAALRARTQSG